MKKHRIKELEKYFMIEDCTTQMIFKRNFKTHLKNHTKQMNTYNTIKKNYDTRFLKMYM